MPRTTPTLFPASDRHLKELGHRIRLARLRRRFTAALVAIRAGITRSTLRKIEQGAASVSLGAYLAVLSVLGLVYDVDLVARDDELGRKLQDLQLGIPRRAPSHSKV